MDLTTLFLREPLPAHLRQLLRLCSANGKTHQLTVPERKPWSNAACDGSLSQGTLKCVLAPSFETNNNAWIDSNPAHRLTDGSRKAASRIHKMRREEVQGFAPLQHGVYFHTQTQTQIQKQQQNGSQCGLPRRRMRSLRWQTAPKAARRPRGQPHRRTAGTPHWSLLVSGASAAHPGPLLLMVLRSSSLPALSLSLSQRSQGLITGTSPAAYGASARHPLRVRGAAWRPKVLVHERRNAVLRRRSLTSAPMRRVLGWGTVCVNKEIKQASAMGSRWQLRHAASTQSRCAWCEPHQCSSALFQEEMSVRTCALTIRPPHLHLTELCSQ